MPLRGDIVRYAGERRRESNGENNIIIQKKWREKMKRRIVAVLLSCSMLIAGLGGCGSSPAPETENKNGVSAENNLESEEGVETAEGTETAEGEKPVVSFVFTKGGFEGVPENDVIKQKMEEVCNITLDHIAPPAANYTEQVNLILSGDPSELPDMVKLNQSMFNDMYDYAEHEAFCQVLF